MSNLNSPPPSPSMSGRNERQLPVNLEFEPDWAIFLDVDGTLVDFRVRPQEVEVTLELKRLLRSLNERLGGALALISGRALGDLERMFPIDDLAMAGLHGVELCGGSPGDVRVQTVDEDALERFRTRIHEFAAQHEALYVEDKGLGIALHYREAPELEAPVEEILTEILSGEEGAFTMLRGKMLAEIRSHAADKGFAIRELMGYKRFNGRRPVFLGDDATDEDGFAAVNAMEGISIKVGNGETLAEYRLATPEAVLDWLARYERYLIDGERERRRPDA